MLWWGNYISSFSFFFSVLKRRRWVVTDYFLFLLHFAVLGWSGVDGRWVGGGRVQLFFGGLLNEGGGIFSVLFHFSAGGPAGYTGLFSLSLFFCSYWRGWVTKSLLFHYFFSVLE